MSDSLVRSAILTSADSCERLRPCDAWRVYEAALALGVVWETKNALRLTNPNAFMAMCEYEAGEIMEAIKNGNK